MLLKTRVNNFSFDIRHDQPTTPTGWIIGCYFKEFLIKVNSFDLTCEEDIEKIKSKLIKAFEVFADYRSHDQDGDDSVFLFQFKESIGIPLLEFFEVIVRRQAKWVIEALNQSIDCEKCPCQVELVIENISATSKLMGN